jgi:hypothetical protein
MGGATSNVPHPARDSGLGNGGQHPPSSMTAGGVLLPRLRQAVARFRAASGGVDEWRIDDIGLGSGPCETRSGLISFSY